MDFGYRIVLSKTGGWILTINNQRAAVLPIVRDDSKWIIDIAKLQTLNTSNVLTKIICGKEFYESFSRILGT